MSKSSRTAAIAVLLVVILAACAWFARGHIQFDWANLKTQLHAVDGRLVLVAIGLIYLSIALRAARWRILLGQATTVSAIRLVPSQFIGFTVVGLFGRVADLARPYLIARRTKTSVATQLAVYSIERAFDLAAAAILFSLTLAFAPHDMPHHETFKKAGLFALAGTAFLTVFAVAVRFAGATVAAIARRVFRLISVNFAESAATKILDFREGLRAIATAGQFFGALLCSLVIWSLIAASYYASAHAFRDCPQLATLTVPATMLLLATSMGGSLLQLPILGWFTQIGVLAVALHAFFGVPAEVASAAGAVLLLVGSLSFIPLGLIAAKLEGVGLRDAARSSEVLEDAVPAVGP